MKAVDLNLFRPIEPPPGGVERFRQRLANVDAPTPMFSRRIFLAGLASALIAVIAVAAFRLPGSRGLQSGGDVLSPAIVATTQELQADGSAPQNLERADLRNAPGLSRLLGQSPGAAETRIAIDDTQVAFAEIPSTSSKIRIYQISSN